MISQGTYTKMKRLQRFAFTMLAAIPLLAHAADRQPNVIVVMADDISAPDFPIYESSTCYGERTSTPVID